jgi:hypothetical protein
MKIKGYHIDHSGIYTSDNEYTKTPSYLNFLSKEEPDTIRVFSNLDDCVAGLALLLKFSPKQGDYLVKNTQSGINYELGNPVSYFVQYIPAKFLMVKYGRELHSSGNVAMYNDASQYATELRILNQSVTGFERAKLARDVASEAYSAFISMGITPSNLISPINVYRRAILDNLDLPNASCLPRDAVLTMYDCCKGGWTEAYQVGHFNEVWDYDINAAYSYWAKNLPDFRYGKWVCSEKPEHLRKASYGYLSVEAEVNSEFSPLIYLGRSTDADRNTTPIGRGKTEATLKMVNYITDTKQGEFKIIKGYYFYPDNNRLTLLVGIMDELYNQRLAATGIKRDIIKGIMLGTYGLFLQVKGKNKGLFMPPFAAEIQTNTQIEVHSFCQRNNLIPLSVMTDGVTSLTPAKENISTELGKWKLAAHGRGLIISSGVSAIEGRNGNAEFGIDYDWAVQYAKEHPEADHFEIYSPGIISLPDAVNRGNVKLAGTIEKQARLVYLNADIKRQYKGQAKNLHDISSNQYISKAFTVSQIASLTRLTGSLSNLRNKFMTGGNDNESMGN